MKKYFLTFIPFLAVFLIFSFIPAVSAATLAQTYSGRIIFNSSVNDKVWYINPADHLRFPLNSASDAAYIMNKLGIGISEGNFQKIASAGMAAKGNLVLAKKLSGKIILQVEKKGEGWYVNPIDLKKYPLGRPADALQTLRGFGVAVTPVNLARISKAFKDESVNSSSNFKFAEKISTGSGTFSLAIAKIDLGKLAPKIITDTAGVENCSANCPAKSLFDYASNQKAFAAIGGVYGAPFYNTLSRRMVNENKLSSVQPLIAFDENNKFYYFPSGKDFFAGNFLADHGANLSAAFVGRVKLMENGKIKSVAASTRMARNAFGFKNPANNSEGSVYLVSARNVTLAELAKVMKAIGVDYAVSLDNGPLFYGDEYKVSGGNMSGAIMFAVK
jgi:hypothetical protein